MCVILVLLIAVIVSIGLFCVPYLMEGKPILDENDLLELREWLEKRRTNK